MICTAQDMGIDESNVIAMYGRRNVLRLPGSRANADIDRRLPRRLSARAFAPGVTLEDINERVASGESVRVVKDGSDADVLPLAAVRPDGTANLQPGSQSPGPDDTIIGFVAVSDHAEAQPAST